MCRSIWVVVLLSLLLVGGCSRGEKSPETKKSTQAASASRLVPPLLPTKHGPGRDVSDFGCPRHPRTTIDFEACSAINVSRLNRKANQLIKLIWSRLEFDKGNTTVARRHFVNAERAWRTYADNECITRSRAWLDQTYPHMYFGGTSAGPGAGRCMEKLTRAHIRDLQDTANWLAPH